MRVLGLDVGERRIGLAVSDPLGITAQGLGVLNRGKLNEDVEQLQALVRKYEIEEIVVGLPRALDGGMGPQAQKVAEFASLLEKKGIKVKFWDERFTTSAAERYLIEADVSREKRRRVIDKTAAVLILQSYLDSRRAPGAGRA
ncbi:MAG: Holliday junction resolvase RuvX [Bacillota bacterium]